jgi:hypothetical protein
MDTLPVLPAYQLTRSEPEKRWLIEGLWDADAVGTIGGEPKSCKSFLALGMAVSVASGRPCLERFVPQRTGRVLLFAAEDALHVVRERLEGICAHFRLDLVNLDLWVITAPAVRLDVEQDRRRLACTVAELKPVLLILDPFVRLHRIDENVSAAVVPLLAFLREIQRRERCAVALVHHARKGAAKVRDGQALRGSSEFHAWSDSSLFLRRRGEQLRMSVEHRAHPSLSSIALTLHTTPSSMALVAADQPAEAIDPIPTRPPSGRERVLQVLADMDHPLHIRDLRSRCRIRTATLCAILDELQTDALVTKTNGGWRSCRPPP